jgi:hypothetical protein
MAAACFNPENVAAGASIISIEEKYPWSQAATCAPPAATSSGHRCGGVLVSEGCVESDDLGRGPEIAENPSEQIGLHGVDRHQDLFDMAALDALKCARVEIQASWPDAQKRHRTLALRTDRNFDWR